MRVIGTAGHVDHGKSTLVHALTGIDPDRLKEEKKRQMTIDLGFAWYESEKVGTVAIVDVPGHRDFIENMLSGVGGIDAVLLVIAADEGIMPQTREHMAIIDLLQIKTGLVVLNKVDLIEDPEWMDLLELDIREFLKGSVLENAIIVRVSAATGEGLPALQQAIDEVLGSLNPRVNTGKARLPVDRVFSISGFGTVVTGTLSGGTFRVDDQIEILPSMVRGRIRGLQSHNKQENEVFPGSRTAMNLSGIDVSMVKRGDTIAHPSDFIPTTRIDARLQLVADASIGVKHDDRVKLFVASAETTARVRLLKKPSLNAGDWAWVQLELEHPIVAEKDDRFIIRRMSPAQTIGGGAVVDPHPKRRYKLDDDQVISRFELLTSPSEQDRLSALIGDHPFITLAEILKQARQETDLIIGVLSSLIYARKVRRFSVAETDSEIYVDAFYWQFMTDRLNGVMRDFYLENPLKIGIHVADLQHRLRVPSRELNAFLYSWKTEDLILENDGFVALAGFKPRYSVNQSKRLSEFWKAIDQDIFNPPNVKDARAALTDEVYQSLLDQGKLVQLSAESFLRTEEYKKMLEFVQLECGKGEILTLAQFRDHFSTSRKIAQAFLEYLDRKGITIRVGEGRKLKK
ncbi:MAG TPA: selenocysteine-specific translation elongation factor [Anaerolineaceae bacterium]|nr:selenocysteine-specific translation elongation factor [Anaerolineaceae bacterium]